MSLCQSIILEYDEFQRKTALIYKNLITVDFIKFSAIMLMTNILKNPLTKVKINNPSTYVTCRI